MGEPLDPIPEEESRLGPPRRRPPTAIGVSAPLPPPRRDGRYRRSWGVFGRLYGVIAAYLVVGIALAVLAPWLMVRVVGGTFAVVGAFVALLLGWSDSGLASRWALWRRTRWIRKRQRELGPPPRPPA